MIDAAQGRDLDATDELGYTVLERAVSDKRTEVVRVLLEAGAGRNTGSGGLADLLDTASTPEIVMLLLEAGAQVNTAPDHTPLHTAVRRSAYDKAWIPVIDALLDHGADPCRLDKYGCLPVDLLDAAAPPELRERMTSALTAAGRSLELELADVATRPHQGLTIHPFRREARTSTFNGAVVVQWQLEPTVVPTRIIRLPERSQRRGPFGAESGERVAFLPQPISPADADNMPFADDAPWDDPSRVIPISEDIIPEIAEAYHIAWSPDARLLAVSSCESLSILDVESMVAHDLDNLFGDWTVLPKFSPDGRRIAVGNSMQGSCWHTMLTVTSDGSPKFEYESANYPNFGCPADIAFSPDGARFALYICPEWPDGSLRGQVFVSDTTTGEPLWDKRIDETTVGADGGPYPASLCFTADGAWLCVGLDAGVLWTDSATGTRTRIDTTTGAVAALGCTPHTGMLAATATGLHRVGEPSLPGGTSPSLNVR